MYTRHKRKVNDGQSLTNAFRHYASIGNITVSISIVFAVSVCVLIVSGARFVVFNHGFSNCLLIHLPHVRIIGWLQKDIIILRIH